MIRAWLTKGIQVLPVLVEANKPTPCLLFAFLATNLQFLEKLFFTNFDFFSF